MAYLENDIFIGDGIVNGERQDTLIDLSFLGVSQSDRDGRNNSCSFRLENDEAITSRPSRIDDQLINVDLNHSNDHFQLSGEFEKKRAIVRPNASNVTFFMQPKKPE